VPSVPALHTRISQKIRVTRTIRWCARKLPLLILIVGSINPVIAWAQFEAAATGRTGWKCGAVRLSVTLHVAAKAGLSTGHVAILRREVEAIWKTHGVFVAWDGPHPVKVLVDAPRDARWAPSDGRNWPMASVLFVNGRPVPSIYLSTDAVSEAIRLAPHPYSLPLLRPQMIARAAGRLIAHEIGHYLLGTGDHAANGLMRAQRSPDALVREKPNADLMPGQVVRVRCTITSESHESLHYTSELKSRGAQ
jgi:hypothetical protein